MISPSHSSLAALTRTEDDNINGGILLVFTRLPRWYKASQPSPLVPHLDTHQS